MPWWFEGMRRWIGSLDVRSARRRIGLWMVRQLLISTIQSEEESYSRLRGIMTDPSSWNLLSGNGGVGSLDGICDCPLPLSAPFSYDGCHTSPCGLGAGTELFLLALVALPAVVSVLNFTLIPCAAICRVNAVLSRMPLNCLGENTSNGSLCICASSAMPSRDTE